MKTEQRQSIRKNVALDVLINRDFTYSKNFRLRDLSLSGARLERGQEGLAPGAPIEAVLTLGRQGKPGQYRVPADVVRVDREGVALRFRPYDDWTYTALVNLLYSGVASSR